MSQMLDDISGTFRRSGGAAEISNGCSMKKPDIQDITRIASACI
jgi:hypothetical protein